MTRKMTLILCLGLLLAGCATRTPQPAGVRIVTSFYPVYISTINVTTGIPGLQVENLIRPQTGCLHDYQLSPRDVVSLSTADIFVINGAGMESFLDKVTRQLPGLRIVDASAGIPLIPGPEGDNPHVWVGVGNAMRQVENIAEGCARADTAHAARYRENAARYVRTLDSLRARMHAALDTLPRRRIVTFHEAFPYFAREFNLEVAGIIERVPGSEPSAGEMASVVRIVRNAGVNAILAEPQYPSKAADVISRETGVPVFQLDPGVTGPAEPDAYIRAMEANMATLERALR